MNFLGHLYLSGTDPEVIVGNFMGDAVKGRDLSRFGPGIERGLRLHRAIDSFTDVHPALLEGRQRVHAHAGRYASVVMDLFYDHILAANWELLSQEPLPRFAQRMYALLNAHEARMPERTRRMLPYMVHGDWLTSYSTLEGIGRALDGLSRRVPAGAPMRGAERVLRADLERYTAEFNAFLPAVDAHTRPLR
ncbi:MAG: ACP phosphodiesterase [Flavobacteriales bacterium]